MVDKQKDDEINEVIDLKDIQVQFVRIVGATGSGKSLMASGECLAGAINLDCKRIVSNMKLLKVPEGVEFCYCTQARDILASMDGTPTIILWDEMDKSVSSRSRTIFSTFLGQLCGDARKSGIKAFIYTCQARKSVSNLVRTNDMFVLMPRHSLDNRGRPQCYAWANPEQAEIDISRGEDGLEDAPLVSSEFDVDFLRGTYDTLQKVPVDLESTLKENELPIVLESFTTWCKKKGIDLSQTKRSDLKVHLDRWNGDQETNSLPWSKKALNSLTSEIIARDLLWKPKEEE